ncbi:hypothetical protein MRB53_039428 [Persea americana]|nr:hypothetical protein MRB53_039428 [Persea americana]
MEEKDGDEEGNKQVDELDEDESAYGNSKTIDKTKTAAWQLVHRVWTTFWIEIVKSVKNICSLSPTVVDGEDVCMDDMSDDDDGHKHTPSDTSEDGQCVVPFRTGSRL